jgi:hypothetical protein
MSSKAFRSVMFLLVAGSHPRLCPQVPDQLPNVPHCLPEVEYFW